MTLEAKDNLDRVIDEALASMVSGDPRRVSAESVREAIAGRRSARLPAWLAVAAVLLVAFGVSFRERSLPGKSANAVATSAPKSVVTVPQAAPSPESTRVESGAFRKTANRTSVEAAIDRAYEGMPRLMIASIELPEPLFTPRLEANVIRIARLEIAPLSVSSISNEQEQQ